ncbi:hypothetical protein POUND7_007585 [Theobroma cacao]
MKSLSFSFSFSAVLLLLLLSFGNQLMMGQSSDCQQSFPDPGCTQDECNNLCIQHFGKTGKYGAPVYGVCFMIRTCICRQC